MWLASILQELYFIRWKERRDSDAAFGNGSGRNVRNGLHHKLLSFMSLCMQRAPCISCQGESPVEVVAVTEELRQDAWEEELEIGSERQDEDAGAKHAKHPLPLQHSALICEAKILH